MIEKQRLEIMDELVIRARTSPDALAVLYEEFYSRILTYCLRRLYKHQAAEDVTSEVFLAVARSIGTFDGTTLSKFKIWLYTIATNQCNAYLRKAIRQEQLLPEAAKANCVAPKNNSDEYEISWPQLYYAIRQLKPEQQSIITLRFFEKMGHKEIAAILQMNAVTVRVNMRRALNQLKKLLATPFYEGGDLHV